VIARQGLDFVGRDPAATLVDSVEIHCRGCPVFARPCCRRPHSDYLTSVRTEKAQL
jgi:hypothetical protein